MRTRQIENLVKPIINGLDASASTLAASIVKQARKRSGNDLDMFADLVQEGVQGVMRARESFDAEQGAFSAYAAYWIRAYIRDYHRTNCRTVDMFRGLRGRKVYENSETLIVDQAYLPEVRFEEASTHLETEGYTLREANIPDPETLCIMKEQAEAVRTLVERSRDAKERAVYETMMGETQDLAKAARDAGCSRQYLAKLSQRLVTDAQRKLKGIR